MRLFADKAGRISVRPDCTLPGHPEVLVIGDMMAMDGCPGVEQVAMQQGGYAAEQITRRLRGNADGNRVPTGDSATLDRFRNHLHTVIRRMIPTLG